MGTPNDFGILNSVILHINVVVYVHKERARAIVVDSLGTIPFVTIELKL